MTSKTPKPQLLLISGLAPWPTTSGGAVRVHQTLKHLSAAFSIHFVCAIESTDNPAEIKTHLSAYCASFTTFQKQPKKSFFSFFSRGVPYWFSEWYNPELGLIARNLIEKHAITVVQIETTQLLYLVPLLPKTVISICTAYDVQLVSFWRRLTETKSWLNRAFKVLLLLQVWHYEQNNLSKADLVTAVSEVDRNYFIKLYGLRKLMIVPNGYEPPHKLKAKSSGVFSIGFIGATTHSPNKTAIEYLLTQIAPLLKKRIGDFEIVLAGDTTTLTPIILKMKNAFSIKQLGFVELLADFYQSIDVLVAPLFSGSGTRIKILESTAHGVPVVTTPVGAEGLQTETALASVLLASNPLEFVAQIEKIKNSPQQLVQKSQPTLQTWQAIFKAYQTKLAAFTNKSQTAA